MGNSLCNVHIISPVTSATFSAAALLAACPSCCRTGLLQPRPKGQQPIRQWEQLLLNQLIKWLAVPGVLSYLIIRHCCVHARKRTFPGSLNAACAHAHGRPGFLLTVAANIAIMSNYQGLCGSNLNAEVGILVRLISGCFKVKLWSCWFWTLPLFSF